MVYLVPTAAYQNSILQALATHVGFTPRSESKSRSAKKLVSRIFLNNSSCSRRRFVAIISCFDLIESELAELESAKAEISPSPKIKIATKTSTSVKPEEEVERRRIGEFCMIIE